MQKAVIEKLKKYEQEHILNYLPIMTEQEQKELEEQILKTDFEQIKKLYQQTKETVQIEEKKIEQIPYTEKARLEIEQKRELQTIGEEIIKQGKYAVATMAGGQGTRLGCSGPKGTYQIDTIYGKKYLFEIIVEVLLKAKEKYGVNIPWYIMTSKENYQVTADFLKEHQYFGYDKKAIMLFKQGELPLLTTQGKVIVDKQKQLKEAADGNGGIYEAMAKDGVIADMEKRNVEWVFIGGIDNILLKFIDPVLLGLTIKENNVIASKSIIKTNPKESVGVFCKNNGRPKIIEYTELPTEMAEERNESGELVYGDVNIISHLFHRSVLEDLENVKLPYHVAFKKSAFLNPNGEYIEVTEPNAYKFEAFVFDVLGRYSKMTLLRVKREEEYAPIKNKEGTDSPETATRLYNQFMSESHENFA